MRDVVVRVLAVAVAVAMVVGALALRDRRTPDTAAPPDASETAEPPRVGDLRVVCSEVVAFACESLAGAQVAAISVLASGVDALDTELDTAPDAVIVTLAPVPELLDDRARRAGNEPRLEVVAEVGWSSPVVAAVWDDRLAVLDDHCGGALAWTCLGEVAGDVWTTLGGDERWGRVAPAHADPDASVSGLLVLSQGIAARTGEVGFSLRDLQADDTRAWLTRLERGIPGGQDDPDQLEQMLTQGRSAMDVGLTIEAEAAELLPRAGARGDGIELRYLDPWLEARVVVAGSDPEAVEAVLGALQDQGERADAAGWRVDGGAPSGLPDAPPAPPDTPLPSAGALEALLSLQAEVVP